MTTTQTAKTYSATFLLSKLLEAIELRAELDREELEADIRYEVTERERQFRGEYRECMSHPAVQAQGGRWSEEGERDYIGRRFAELERWNPHNERVQTVVALWRDANETERFEAKEPSKAA